MQSEFCEHFLNVAAAVLAFKRKFPRGTFKEEIIVLKKKLLKCCFAIKKQQKTQDAATLPLKYLYACIFF